MNKIFRNKHFQFGLPFLLAVVGGSFGLKYYSQLRYDIQRERKITTKTDELKAMIGEKQPITIEEAYEEYKGSVDLDRWENKRGPRPWEEGNEDYKALIEKRASESKNQWIFQR